MHVTSKQKIDCNKETNQVEILTNTRCRPMQVENKILTLSSRDVIYQMAQHLLKGKVNIV